METMSFFPRNKVKKCKNLKCRFVRIEKFEENKFSYILPQSCGKIHTEVDPGAKKWWSGWSGAKFVWSGKRLKNIAPIRNDIGPIRNEKTVFPHHWDRMFFFEFSKSFKSQKYAVKIFAILDWISEKNVFYVPVVIWSKKFAYMNWAWTFYVTGSLVPKMC